MGYSRIRYNLYGIRYYLNFERTIYLRNENSITPEPDSAFDSTIVPEN